MAQNYILLERIELAASAASVTLNNLPQSGYTDLKIVISARSDESGGSAQSTSYFLAINGVSTDRSWRVLGAYGGSTSYSSSGTTGKIGTIPGTAVTANTFNSTEVYFPNYLSGAFKSYSVDTVTENNSSSNNDIGMFAGLWSSTATISSVTVTSGAGNIVAGSTFSIYGLAAVGTTPAIAPKALGGNRIDYDGTYWYHTFTSSGTFTPDQSLTCDYLVVAGGGGGGTNSQSGGGAGGGMRCTVGATGGTGSLETPLSLATSAYTVTVGAGGTAGANGSDSVFSTITSLGGGYGGAGATPNGNTGGSGGGARWFATGGAGNSNQGYAGGNANSADFNNSRGGAGGGGAGAVGGDYSPATSSKGTPASAGNGGNGRATSISGTSTTYAGGGGGGGLFSTDGWNTTKGTGGTGGGGNGCQDSTTGTAGGTNTGGGGGGSALDVQSGLAGGSGIVIVRYLA
jgi:hypothetical protein